MSTVVSTLLSIGRGKDAKGSAVSRTAGMPKEGQRLVASSARGAIARRTAKEVIVEPVRRALHAVEPRPKGLFVEDGAVCILQDEQGHHSAPVCSVLCPPLRPLRRHDAIAVELQVVRRLGDEKGAIAPHGDCRVPRATRACAQGLHEGSAHATSDEREQGHSTYVGPPTAPRTCLHRICPSELHNS